MDKRIEKNYWSRRNIMYFIGISVLVLVLVFAFKSFNKRIYKLDANRITIKEVVVGNFQNMILIDGDVDPIQLVLVNTLEGGVVEEVYIEDGALVEKGTPLLLLSNPGVTMGYMNQETAIIEQINNLRNLKLSLEKDVRNLDEALIDSDNNLGKTGRQFLVDSALYVQQIIAKNDYIEILESYRYQQKKNDFLARNLTKTVRDNVIQIQQINTSIHMMMRNLDMIHLNMERMLVKAPVTGRLSSFDPDIGMTFDRNQNVAKIDVLSGFKVKGWVDEYYLTSVKKGQNARFSFNGKLVELKVKKVLPEVVNKRFEIELIFAEEVPEAITIGQSVQVRLELSKSQESLLIPRGDYFQSSGGQYVYVIDNEGNAVKRTIKLGSQNPSYYQVLGGLQAGERFISSSYENYKTYEIIKIHP